MYLNTQTGDFKMTKIQMSKAIASALLNAQVDENNWKVQDLMKRSKSELESHMRLADQINNANEMSAWNNASEEFELPIKKMCKDCKQMYVPVLRDDDDCCPSCARF
jgi:hypothetical protein